MNRRAFLSSLLVAPMAIPAVAATAATTHEYAFFEGPLPERPILFREFSGPAEDHMSREERYRLIHQIVLDHQEAIDRAINAAGGGRDGAVTVLKRLGAKIA